MTPISLHPFFDPDLPEVTYLEAEDGWRQWDLAVRLLDNADTKPAKPHHDQTQRSPARPLGQPLHGGDFPHRSFEFVHPHLWELAP